MASWKSLFKPWILARGQEYFECGQVVELKESSSHVLAQVSGTQLYQVEIDKDRADVLRMGCNCPYADGGENCKHMAAVLFALDEATEETRLDWQTALQKLPVEQLRGLLRSLAEGDGSLQDRIVRMISGPGDDPTQWQNCLDQIILDHTDYRGRIVYGQAYKCMLDIAEYLGESLPHALSDGHIFDAAKLVLTVYGSAFGLDTGDEGDGLAIVSEACQQAMAQILQLSDAQQERKIFYLLHEFLDDSDWSWGTDDLEEWILNIDWSRELQEKNLQWLDENLDSWKMPVRAALMKRMGATTAEVIVWWEQYQEYDEAYRALLELYEEHDLPKAIELVQRKRKQKQITVWQIAACTKTLLRLLEKSGNQEQYKKELRYLILDLGCQETKYLSRLKDCTPQDQWIDMFAAMVADAKQPSERMLLYHFEGMYEKLFVELSQYSALSNFYPYEQPLREWDPERTLKLYVKVLKIEMDRVCDRKEYRRVIRYLHELESYPGGREEAIKLAAYWHVCHKNRPAMRDELQTAGFPPK